MGEGGGEIREVVEVVCETTAFRGQSPQGTPIHSSINYERCPGSPPLIHPCVYKVILLHIDEAVYRVLYDFMDIN